MNLPPFPRTLLRDLYPSDREQPRHRDERHPPSLALSLRAIAVGWRALFRSRRATSCNRTLCSESPDSIVESGARR